MLSHPGLVRRGNEDACAALPEAGAFVVCDGMGGAAAGEVASRLAADSFLNYISGQNGNAAVVPQRMLAAAIDAANNAVYRYSRQSAKLEGMGTTLVALVAPVRQAKPDMVWLAHVGDSRGYRLRGGHLEQLTPDHTFVAEQLRAGQITSEQAANSPMRNMLTRAVGTRPVVEAEITEHDAIPGDLYLLASDGLTHELTDDAIEAILAAVATPFTQAALAQGCEALIAAANQNGGRDNITVLLAAVLDS
ncbi:MAG TPA: PP2C family serine/threonine-protein phosphatase [Edaphobacter sp.]|nr:PP2C family serine/threonine-protein phosphatase [Edaphobacter sp.]